MVWLVVGTFVLMLGLYGLKSLSRANPARLASMSRGLLGGALGLVALYLVLRGQAGVGGMVGAVSLWLLGLSTARPFGGLFDGLLGRNAGGPRVSTVRSRLISMRLDLDSGDMDGTVVGGAFAGAQLHALGLEEARALYQECLADDPDGARLLEPYLDRRFAGWRAAGEGDGDARRSPAVGTGMSQKEAYETLGLAPGASGEEIRRAHRELMKKLHPDHGGSANLAARVNEAKAVLLGRHH